MIKRNTHIARPRNERNRYRRKSKRTDDVRSIDRSMLKWRRLFSFIMHFVFCCFCSISGAPTSLVAYMSSREPVRGWWMPINFDANLFFSNCEFLFACEFVLCRLWFWLDFVWNGISHGMHVYGVSIYTHELRSECIRWCLWLLNAAQPNHPRPRPNAKRTKYCKRQRFARVRFSVSLLLLAASNHIYHCSTDGWSLCRF